MIRPALAFVPLALLLATPAHALRLDPEPSAAWLTVDRMSAICDQKRRLEARLDQLIAQGDPKAETVRGVIDFCGGQSNAAPTEAQWHAAGDVAFPRGVGVRSTAGMPNVGFGGASWQSAVLEGLTSLIIERAKAELVMGFITGLEKNLCGAEAARRFFPDTCRVLAGQVDEDGGEALPVFGGVLRAAMAADVGGWPEALAADACGAALFTAAGVAVGQLVTDGHDPMAVLASLEKADYRPCDGEIAEGLALLGRAVKRLAPSEEAGEPTHRLFAALGRELEVDPHDLKTLYDRLRTVRALVEAVQARPDDAATFRRYGNATLDVLLMALDSGDEADAAPTGRAAKSRGAAAQTAQTDADRTDAARTENAPAGAATLDEARARAILKRIQSLLHAIRVQDYGQAVVDTMGLASQLETKLPEPVTRYAGFAAELAGSRTSEDVTNALESAAVPIGTWKRKRRDGVTSIMVNSYMGLGAGAELLSGDRAPKDAKGHAGLSVPVGIEISRGFGKFSVGGFISIIDVGTIASFRLGETKQSGDEAAVDTTPTWTLEQVLAPGFHAVVGITDVVPISVGVGISMSPGLREGEWTSTDADGVETISKAALTAVRVGAFIAVDVPLFEL